MHNPSSLWQLDKAGDLQHQLVLLLLYLLSSAACDLHIGGSACWPAPSMSQLLSEQPWQHLLGWALSVTHACMHATTYILLLIRVMPASR